MMRVRRETHPTTVLGFETMAELVRVSPAQPRPMAIYFSRFPDAPDGAERAAFPRSPDLVSIHHHAIERGRFLVIEWSWDGAQETWRQTSIVNAPSLDNAREYVPPGAELRRCPAEFGLEAWVVR